MLTVVVCFRDLQNTYISHIIWDFGQSFEVRRDYGPCFTDEETLKESLYAFSKTNFYELKQILCFQVEASF